MSRNKVRKLKRLVRNRQAPPWVRDKARDELDKVLNILAEAKYKIWLMRVTELEIIPIPRLPPPEKPPICDPHFFRKQYPNEWVAAFIDPKN